MTISFKKIVKIWLVIWKFRFYRDGTEKFPRTPVHRRNSSDERNIFKITITDLSFNSAAEYNQLGYSMHIGN